MKKYSKVLFDLDGTIIDSGEGVTNSVAYALEKFGIVVEDKHTLECFIGPPLIYSFMTFYGFDEQKANKAIEYYREYYTEKGIFEGYIYDGIEALLKKLKKAEKTVILATSKPEIFAKRILDKAGLSKYFDYIAGASLDEKTRTTKIEVLDYVIKECKIDTESAIMIGDRFYDIEGARAFGIPCVAVLYGYGSAEEFKKYEAEYIVDKAENIAEILI
ncbi:MAG: HAD-IA family hydrolase [Clostridia bacterium]|nr:HAD-IA family hydrolase [Clostridia bacterium]